MCHSDEIRPADLPGSITRAVAAVNGVSAGRRNEKEVIAEALQRNDGSRSQTARELGMHRSTLWRKVRMYGLDN